MKLNVSLPNDAQGISKSIVKRRRQTAAFRHGSLNSIPKGVKIQQEQLSFQQCVGKPLRWFKSINSIFTCYGRSMRRRHDGIIAPPMPTRNLASCLEQFS